MNSIQLNDSYVNSYGLGGSSSLDEQAKPNISNRERIYKAINAVDPKKAESFMRCGEDAYILECQQCGYRHVVKVHCKLRICPQCQGAKTAVWMRKYEGALKELVSEGYRLRFVTLTIRNVDDLSEGVRKIQESFKRLRRRKYYRERMLGGLYGVEATIGRDGRWNVHVHVLVVGAEWGYIDQRRLSEDWERITGDSKVVWVEKVRGKGVRGALRYVLKYVAKGIGEGEGWTSEKLVEFMMVLEGKHLIQPFGILMGKVAKERVFECPVCGGCVWRVICIDTGEVVYDELERLKAKARSP